MWETDPSQQETNGRRPQSATNNLGRRTVLKGLAAGSVGSFAFAGAAAGKPGKQGVSGKCDIAVPDDYSTIQDAVDAANTGDTICVGDGTYSEQVVVNKSVTLQNKDGESPTIEPGTSPKAFTIPESSPTWEPMVFAYGGSESGGAVSGAEIVDVDLSGFTLDGNDTQPAARRKPGVLYRNAVGPISDNTIENMGVGGKETFGVLAYGNSDVKVVGNSVSGYERGGIGANGDGGAQSSPTADIRDNTVIGSANLGEAWGPNGIQVGFGAEGQVRNNEVRDNRYSDEGPVAAGILIFESDEVAVRDNTVANADIGLSCGSWGWFRASADGNQFMKNYVVDTEFGALLEAVAEPYDGVLTQADPSVSNTKVTHNSFEDDEETAEPDGNIGVGVVVDDNNIDNAFEPVAANNKIVRNTITGFETQIEDEGTGTKVGPIEP